MIFKNEGRVRIFSDRQKLEELTTSRSTLEEVSKAVLQAEEQCGNIYFELLHSDPPSASQKFNFSNNHSIL